MSQSTTKLSSTHISILKEYITKMEELVKKANEIINMIEGKSDEELKNDIQPKSDKELRLEHINKLYKTRPVLIGKVYKDEHLLILKRNRENHPDYYEYNALIVPRGQVKSTLKNELQNHPNLNIVLDIYTFDARALWGDIKKDLFDKLIIKNNLFELELDYELDELISYVKVVYYQRIDSNVDHPDNKNSSEEESD